LYADEYLRQVYEHGVDNVRGSVFVAAALDSYMRNLILQLVCDRKRLCFRCGRGGHLKMHCVTMTRMIASSHHDDAT
jgi:hypothetical protein